MMDGSRLKARNAVADELQVAAIIQGQK